MVLNFMWMLNSITTSEYFTINWIPFTFHKTFVHFNLIWDKNNWSRQTFKSKRKSRFHARLSWMFTIYIIYICIVYWGVNICIWIKYSNKSFEFILSRWKVNVFWNFNSIDVLSYRFKYRNMSAKHIHSD